MAATGQHTTTVDAVLSAAAADASDAEVRRAVEAHLTAPSSRALVGQWSARTREEYVREWRRFKAWCRPATEGLPPVRWFCPMPCAPDVLAEYLAFLAQHGAKPSTIRKARAAIVAWHRLRGEPVPDGAPASGVQREHRLALEAAGWEPDRAEPFPLEHLVTCLASLDRSQPAGMRDAVLLLLSYGGLLTLGELSGLDIASVRFGGRGVSLVVPRGVVHVPHWTSTSGEHHPALCPPEAATAWVSYLASRESSVASPLMRGVDQHGRVAGLDPLWLGGLAAKQTNGRMTPTGITHRFRQIAVRAGVPDAARYTFQSLRVGALGELRRRGATISEAYDAGRWSRHTAGVLGYLALAEEQMALEPDSTVRAWWPGPAVSRPSRRSKG